MRPSTNLALAILLLTATPLTAASDPYETKLFHADGAAWEKFGSSVAISGDVLVIGATGDRLPGAPGRGTATTYRRIGSGWVEEQRFSSSTGTSWDDFGAAIAMSADVIVVGSPLDDIGINAWQGSATVFRWSAGIWVEEQHLIHNAGSNSDFFGSSVSVSGDVLVVGRPGADVAGISFAGSVTVYRWNGTSWAAEQELTAGDLGSDAFGASVSVSGDVIAVGAPSDGANGGFFANGSATIFRWDGSSWNEEHKVLGFGYYYTGAFGSSIWVQNDVLVVGTPAVTSSAGSARVYRWNGASWTKEQSLKPMNSHKGDLFGSAVAVSDDTIVIGASTASVGFSSKQGSATTFLWNGVSWVEDHALTANDGASGDKLGSAVAIHDGVVVVSSRSVAINGNIFQGAAYAFDTNPAPWSDQGGALSGVFGSPLLQGNGPLEQVTANSVDLTNAAPFSPASLFIALSSTPVPFKGGTLLAFPFLGRPAVHTTGPAGDISIPFVMPAGVPTRSELWFQWAIHDDASIHGAALSNAIKGVTP